MIRGLVVSLALLTSVGGYPAAPVHGQVAIGAAPLGEPKIVAASAIRDAGHPCGKVLSAVRRSEGDVRAVCSNGETYRIFTVKGEAIAMRCSAAAKIGVTGC